MRASPSFARCLIGLSNQVSDDIQLQRTYLDWVPVRLGKEIVMEVLDDVG